MSADLREELLNDRQAAKFLGVSRDYLKKLRASGQGPAHERRDDGVFYRREDLLAWQEARVLPADALDSREAARFLGLSPYMMSYLRAKDDGPEFRMFKKRVYYQKEDLIAWQEARKAPEGWLDARQAASFLGLSLSCFYTKASPELAGGSRKIGHRLYYSREDLLEFKARRMPPAGLLGSREAAKFLGISRKQLYALNACVLAPASQRHGGKVFYKKEDLIAWKEAHDADS